MNNYYDDGILDAELAFCDTFKKNENEPVALREAACLKTLFEYYFRPMRQGDLLAGRVKYPLVGMSAENTTGGILIYCKQDKINELLDKYNFSREYRTRIKDMTEYMKGQVFIYDDSDGKQRGKMAEALPDDILDATTNCIALMHGRLAGTIINYDKLMTLGLPGLINEVKFYKEKNASLEPFSKFKGGSRDSAYIYDGIISALESLRDVCRRYARQARRNADTLTDNAVLPESENINGLIYGDLGANQVDEKKAGIHPNKEKQVFTGAIYDNGSVDVGTHIDSYSNIDGWKAELKEIADALENIAEKKPSTLREALQLTWLYTLSAYTSNYGRMDIYAGDFYVNDIQNGTLTEEKALMLVQSFWRLTVSRRIAASETAEFNARVVVGGKGRRNTENADKFALLAMEATRTVVETEPQLTLRLYKGMNQQLIEKALDVIGEGRIYPMLYNDDSIIPGVMKSFGVPEDIATLYYPYGCGEYVLSHTSVGSPNCSFNTLKTLEITLHNGIDPKTGLRVGLETGTPDTFTSFDKLWNAYTKQIEYFACNLGKRHTYEYKVEASQMCFLLSSALYDDCLEKGRGLCDRGPRYSGSIIESFALVNTGDSLYAIKKLVYDKKIITLDRLIELLDNNFAGGEKEYKMIKSLPKYGNDNDEVDEMVKKTFNHLADYCCSCAEDLGLDYFQIVNINNWYNVELAKQTGASADGRTDGAPFANGNTPTAGNDISGPTAMLNSISKMRSDNNAGYSHNMKFNKAHFKSNRAKISALLSGYWEKGGTQAMITAVSRGDLEDAMENPEKYANLIVRVGGFSARFIELKKEIQLDLINRTMHDA